MSDTTNDPLAILFIDRTTPKGRADWLRVVLEKLDSREQQALREAIEQRDAELKRRGDTLAEVVSVIAALYVPEPKTASQSDETQRFVIAGELTRKAVAALREWEQTK